MDKKVTAMTIIITPKITPCRRQNGVTLPWRISEMALLQKSLCNGVNALAQEEEEEKEGEKKKNMAGYTATLVACGWAGAVMEKVTGAFGREQ